jgi:hypothetical protein
MNVAYNRTIKQFQNLQRDLAQFESGRHLDDVQQGLFHCLHFLMKTK